MLCAPLISGNDLAHMKPEVLQIFTNPEVIAVNQDKFGVQAFVYSTNANVEIWFKPLAGGDWAMCALNRGKQSQNTSFDWKNEKVGDALSKRDANFSVTTYALQNLWTHQPAGTTADVLSAEIPGHDLLMLRLKENGTALDAGAQKNHPH